MGMIAIGVVDDRDEDLQLIVDGIRLGLKEQESAWFIIGERPFQSIDDYPSWISEHKICSLVIDEMLDEAMIDGNAVDYRGHELVDYIRHRFPTLPIFVITAYGNDPSLRDRFSDVEDIIDRAAFGTTYADYVPRITRAAQKYLEIFQAELNLLSNYAYKAAVGESISDDEMTQAQAIQKRLDIAYSLQSITEVSTWLNKAANLVDEIEEVKQEIEKYLVP